MTCRFSFIDDAPDAVVLRLFLDDRGTARGDVTGPVIAEYNGKPTPHVDRCILEAELAYFTAIRIANATDSELVVCGDATLWDSAWGELVDQTPRSISR